MSIRRRSRASSRPSPVELEVPADPNTFTWPERSRKKFVQLVALQCLVSPAPITAEHPITLEPIAGSGRRLLPQKTEREIADHFAFLAAGDGSGAACCIEEEEEEGEEEQDEGRRLVLRFRLAMNEGVPEGVLEGLKAVLKEVRRVANGEQAESDIKAAVWANVLALSQAKVHADLVDRFTRGSRPLREQFADALGLREHATPTATDPITEPDALATLHKIHDLCTRLTSDPARCVVVRDLDRLLDTCYRFRGTRSFKSALKTVPARRALAQLVEKLGRYKTASNALVLAARKLPRLFAHVSVERVPLLPPAEAQGGFKGVYVGAVAQELTGAASEAVVLSRLRAITGLAGERLAGRYQELCQSTPTAHAEMQLVKFYEESAGSGGEGQQRRPGFIGCSKKACFLCGLFLQLQRRFAVSKAHQNIYHAWTVPTIRCASPENAVMLDFVVEKMSRIIEDSCKKMLWEKPEGGSPHKDLTATTFSAHPPSSSSGFATPHSPLSPISPGFSRPSTAASNLHSIRASPARQTPKPSLPPAAAASKVTDSSGDSSSPEPGSPNLSSESSCTSVSEDSSKESESPASRAPRRQPRTKHTEAAAVAVAVAVAAERMPAIMAAEAPPVPMRSASRARESPAAARPGSSRSVRSKRGSPAEEQKQRPQTQTQTPQQPVITTITRSQSVRVSRRAAAPAAAAPPPLTPKAPARSVSVARRPAAAPEIPARVGRARPASAMEVRKAPALSDAESVSPGTASRPFGPLRRAHTAPTETTAAAAPARSAIPMPRSVSRSNRKATAHSTPPATAAPQPRSPSQVRYTRVENPARRRSSSSTTASERERDPSPGHITSSLRHESPISIARFETAMAMAVTSITASPTMVELPPCRASSGSESSSSTRTTPRASPNVSARASARARVQKRMSPLSVEHSAGVHTGVAGSAPAAETPASAPAPPPAAAAGLGLKRSTSRNTLRDSFASAATSQTVTETISSSTTAAATAIEYAPTPSPAPAAPALLLITDPEEDEDAAALAAITVATPHGISIVDSSEESSLPTPPRRSITERRGRALKRVEPPATSSSTSTTSTTSTAAAATTPGTKRPRSILAVERKRAAIDRATADAAAFVQENGFEAQRKRGMTIADVVQASGFQAQINRGMSVRAAQAQAQAQAQTYGMGHGMGLGLRGGVGPKGYYSDTETIRTRLRGGALSTISSEEATATGTGTAAMSSSRSRLAAVRRPQETEYTLYLAGPDHDDRTLGEKIFHGRLSDSNNNNGSGSGSGSGGEMKQRAGCRLRTALRPAEKEITGMRVKEVSKSLEEMVLDIFFPDAVLRLEVVWDGQLA